ncbi:1-phosphofructokinase [Ruminococcus albus]|uniref:Tagatose-6-phosphate kinase n=1 Tax=Ruminococcus albus TaxID=1264 RepID=A0A1H7QFT5_RUMAL|nr:1-phosphofructokinase [Ruminococcus albus]SEL46970.1 fructose-1-phosphate kinase [Ruminococcus albus]
MIYTVTFNPAIDYVVRMDDLKLGEVNRASYEAMFFGGKGINVSIVLNELGIKSRTLGFTAGFTGEAIENGLRSMGIDADFVRLEKGNSRINVKIKANEETEINGQGPHIDDNALTSLFEKLDNLKDGDTLILAGSIPNSLPSDIYEKIMQRLSGRNIKTVVDATKDLLLNVLKYKPFLIKPNNHELGEMFGIKLSTIEEIEEYARKLQEKGARNVLISMAGDGALLIDENGKTHISGVCKGIVKNSVGAGDSMVAGFVAGSLDGNYEYALKLGTAAGGATAFSDGLATKEKITELLNTL